MKNRAFSLLASIALLSFASCTDEMQELAGEQSQAMKQIVMTAEDFQPEAGGRTVYQIADGAVKCTWAANDTVGVFPDEGAQAYFPMASGAGTKNATFDGKGWALKDGRTYGAYYPCIGKFYLDRNAVPISYTGQTQTGNASMEHLGAYDYMVATPTAPEFGSAQFMFKHISALVQLKITIPEPATLTSVKLVTDTKAFAVEGTMDIMAKTPGITPLTTNTEMVLNLDDVTTTKENEVVTFYFMLPPADLSGKTLKAVLVSDKGTQDIALGTRNFKAGTAYVLSGELESSTPGYKDGVVTIAEAGTMKQLLGDNWLNITSLKVVGPINGDDVRCLRQMLGGNLESNVNVEKGELASLDLSDASIVEGGSYYYSSYYYSYSYYYTSNDMIGGYMFYKCANLQDIVLPVGVTKIGDYAFQDCYSLTSITIPDDVTKIGGYAFQNCSSLKSVHITDLSTWCKITFGNTYSNPLNGGAKLYLNNQEFTESVIPEEITEIKAYVFSGCSSLISINIPEGVTMIGNNAFSGCSSLTSIDIPESITEIGDYAFENCRSLISINIPEGVTTIRDFTFFGCSSLTSIDIPKGVIKIGDYAFRRCYSLTSIDIPNSVVEIGDYAFGNCSSLTSIDIPDSITEIGDYAFEDCRSLTSIDIPDSVTKIGDYAFKYCSNLTSVIIGKGVTAIGNYAFEDCSSLTSVIMGKGVITIGYYAFSYCSSLTSIDIPEGVTTIGDNAFRYCSSLTSIIIPNSITAIGNETFAYCYSLKSVHITDLSAWCNITFESYNSNPLFYRAKLYLNNQELTKLVIPADIKRIKDYTFFGCESIKNITIGEQVTSLGIQSFRNCSSLAQVYCQGTTPPTINPSSTNSSFSGSGSSRTLYVPKGCSSAYQSSSWASFFETITEME